MNQLSVRANLTPEYGHTVIALRVERLYLDREFFCVPVIRWLQALDMPFEMPAIIRGKHGGTKQLIRGRRSYKTSYTLNSDKYGSVTFTVWIVCTYKNGHKIAAKNWAGFVPHRSITGLNDYPKKPAQFFRIRLRKSREHGREIFVYAVYKVKLTLQLIHDDYRLRFGIESSYE